MNRTGVMPACISQELYCNTDVNVQQNVFKRYCRIYDVAFQYLPDSPQLDCRFCQDDIDFDLSDPHCNFRRSFPCANLACDVFTKNDMTALVEPFENILQLGAHGHIFYADTQFCDLLEVFGYLKEDVTYINTPDDKRTSSKRIFAINENGPKNQHEKRAYLQPLSKSGPYAST